MIPVLLSDVFGFSKSISALAREFDPFKFRIVDGPNEMVDDQMRQDMLRRYGEISAFCETYDLPVSKACCTEILGILAHPETSKGLWLNGPTTELWKRLKAELETKQSFMLETEPAKYFDSLTIFGKDVTDKFPSANFDIEEAGQCFALGRSTAAVLHLMRVLEIGLHAVANSLKVPFEEKNLGMAFSLTFK